MIRTSFQNIIFDLGGVILNIDYGLTLEAFRKLGIKNPEEQFTQLKQTPLFDDFETGRISSDGFRDGLREYISVDVTERQIDDAWNAMLLDLPVARLELLENLGKTHRIFLLSNTNEIHIKEFHCRLKEWFGFTNLTHIFERVYYSYEMGERKPNTQIFQSVIQENGLDAQETLFIDDSAQHIEGAKAVGLQTHFLKPEQQIIELFGQGFS